MTYQSLYRKYRPQTFDDVIGQETIVKALQNAILKEKISHAYLFTGPRGTGKTTMAKLLAKAINCESNNMTICGECSNCLQSLEGNHPDIVEIDAASNNGVDEIRSLIERVKFSPIVGKYKVYIIDEVHMLSLGAFNALLKTLEEPPSHVVFILATTEIHKVLPTIISRCQRYDFTRIDNSMIAKRLDRIVENEQREIEEGASYLLASLSAGGMRNALTHLEQALILNDGIITKNSIYTYNGMILPTEKISLFNSLKNKNIKNLLDDIKIFLNKTVDIGRMVLNLVSNLKDSLIYKHTKEEKYINQNDLEFIHYLAQTYTTNEIMEFSNILLNYHEKIRFSSNPEIHFELAIIEMYEKTKKTTNENEVENKSENTKFLDEIEHDDVEENEYPVFEEKETDTDYRKESIKENYLPINNEVGILEEPTEDKKEEMIENEVKESDKIATESVSSVEEKQNDETNTETNVSHETFEEKNKLDLDEDEIIQLMVSADKELRFKDSNLFDQIKRYLSDLRWAKESKLLNNTQVALSGERFILVVTQNQISARAILDEANLYDLLAFTEELLGTPKQVFAVPASQFKKAIETFKDLSLKNELPESLANDDFVTLQEETRDEKTDLVLDLFGDLVEIKE